jgi:non-heme chloroperoxidase
MRLARACALGAIVALQTVPLGSAPPEAPPPSEALTAALLKTSSGIVLHYVVQGDPKGPAVVLVHGIGDSWHSWELVLPLIPKSFRTFALTLRGHGLSDRPASGYTRADFAADVTAFLTGLSLEDVSLVGHSLGSFAAQEAAAGAGASRIRRLVLVGSAPFGPRDPAVLAELKTFFGSFKEPIDASFARDFQLSTAFRPLPPVFLETMIAELRTVPARLWHEFGATLATPRPVEHLKQIKASTLLVWGDKDAMITKADQDALLAGIQGSRLVVYPNTGHAPHWEEPERFANDLVGFLQK